MHQLNTTTAAAQIGCTPRTVRRLAGQHAIGQRVGRDWIFTAADVAKLRRQYAKNIAPPAAEMARRGRRRWKNLDSPDAAG